MDVLDIVKKYLDENGYDGLYSDYECACLKDDLAPCGEMNMDCRAGYKQKCKIKNCEYDWCIGADKDGKYCRDGVDR